MDKIMDKIWTTVRFGTKKELPHSERVPFKASRCARPRSVTPQRNQRRAEAPKRVEDPYLEAFSTATATATVAPTMGLLPIEGCAFVRAPIRARNPLILLH